MDFAIYAAAVSEGQCPRGHGELERRDDLGWCEGCRTGYRMRTAREDEQWMGAQVVEEFYAIELDIELPAPFRVTHAKTSHFGPA